MRDRDDTETSIDFSITDATLDTPRRRFLAALGATGGGVLGLASVNAAASDDDTTTQDDEPDPFSSIEFSNQYTDEATVVVDSTVLSDGGWITFHDTSLFEGKPLESVVGISDYLDPGIHYQVPATLFDVPGRTFDQSQLEGTTALIAMPHRDTNDNQKYEFVTTKAEQDPQYIKAGFPVVDLGQVTVGEATQDPTSFARLDFENQAAEDDTVTVRNAVLSEGGFVILHDARLLQGNVFESVVGVSDYLAPGEHAAVEVELDDPSAVTRVAFPPAPPLIPMPHLDTNGNREYDFLESNGTADGPYVQGGGAVVDLGFVTFDDD